MKSKKIGFASVDEYIASFPEATRRLLEQIRAIIRNIAPEAREKISYQIGGVELNGRNLIHFAGWKKHISIYPIPSGSDAFNTEIAPYADGKGTLKFPTDKPLPLRLIEKVVRLHVAENVKRTKQSKK